MCRELQADVRRFPRLGRIAWRSLGASSPPARHHTWGSSPRRGVTLGMGSGGSRRRPSATEQPLRREQRRLGSPPNEPHADSGVLVGPSWAAWDSPCLGPCRRAKRKRPQLPPKARLCEGGWPSSVCEEAVALHRAPSRIKLYWSCDACAAQARLDTAPKSTALRRTRGRRARYCCEQEAHKRGTRDGGDEHISYQRLREQASPRSAQPEPMLDAARRRGRRYRERARDRRAHRTVARRWSGLVEPLAWPPLPHLQWP